MIHQIEKGVPLPPAKKGRAGDPECFSAILRSMEIGDSILVDRPQKECPNHSKLFPMKFTTRKVSENQTRIWRVA